MNEIEKIFIIQPIFNDNYKVLHDEAISLIESAGAMYFGTCYQNIKQVNPATFIGSGKLAEINSMIDGVEDMTILFNGELSPSQTLNISAALENRKVIDRTTLILDIFARNAVSSEGKIQVELAQLKYIYPRLKGKGAALSRLGGGIGSRGPGETQLETDRRHIRYRIKYLEDRLKETESRRTLQTVRRQKTKTNVIALVGYTNTGKSSLMNLLTGADVLEKNALFATLDPTARKLEIDGAEFLLIDTVGFIQELPHDIVEAFKSTLESAVNCDLALFVADATGDYEMQFKITHDVLSSLGFNKKYIKVLNKCDLIEDFSTLPADAIYISAKKNMGIDNLRQKIMSSFSDAFITLDMSVSYQDFGEYSSLNRYYTEKSREYTQTGMDVTVVIEKEYISKFQKFITN